jgi:ribosomal protein S18 acetylase RimI-like enzyme
LRQTDLPLFRPLRLEALCQHPEAFGSSFEEEQGDDMARMIGEPPNVTLGGFAAGALVGTAALVVSPKLKQRHKGHVVGVYIAPAWRRTGLGQGLIDRLIQEARGQGLAVLTLSVTIGNAGARRLYTRAGFAVYGVEPLGLRVGTVFLDEELMALRLNRTVGDTQG